MCAVSWLFAVIFRKVRFPELPFARYLVELIRRVEREDFAHLAAGKVSIGVAAYPQKHPESASLLQDIEILLSKQRAGADFAITQVFFEDERYSALVGFGAPGRAWIFRLFRASCR